MYDISLFWIIVVGILNLITIIVFFVMASNVRKIKRAVCKDDNMMDDDFWNVVKEEVAVGNREVQMRGIKVTACVQWTKCKWSE